MSRHMSYCRLFSIAFIFFYAISDASERTHYIVDEGKGIRSVVVLGENITKVIEQWGKPDRAAKDDFPYATDMFYEYHERGVLFSSDQKGTIKSITFYCNTGNKEKFHKTGVMWINPSSIYSTFRAKTSKGLVLRDKMKPEAIYDIYGKPEMTIRPGETDDIKTFIKKGTPFIYDMGKAGYSINYPAIGLSFTTFADMVESMDISID